MSIAKFCLAGLLIVGSLCAADAPTLTLLNQIQEHHVAIQRKVAPAVVAIESKWRKNDRGVVVGNSSYGAGVVVSSDGLILTSYSACPHATNFRPDDEAEKVSVYFPNGRLLEARILGFNDETETRLLQAIPPAGETKVTFVYLELADSTKAQVGELAYTAGNPHRTISQDGQVAWSVGTISGIYTLSPACRRCINKESRYRGPAIETDAAVNPGSDGGPLLDANGRLLGLLTLSYCESRWLGASVPVHVIKQNFPELAALPLVSPTEAENANNSGLRAARAVELGLTFASQQAQKAMVKLYVQRERAADGAADDAAEFQEEQAKPGTALRKAIRRRPNCPVSGVIVDPAGFVLTSAFNVSDDSENKNRELPITAQLSDGTKCRVQQLGSNLGQDVCLLKLLPLNGKALPNLEPLFIPLSPSPNLREGRFVSVLGLSEDGLQPTRTMGIVSALSRLDGGVVQTDALINYGNSGGAVIDLLGHLVGIASHMKPSTAWSLPNTGVGFFAQSDRILQTMEDMKLGFKAGKVRSPPRPFPGFTVDDTMPDYQGVKIENVEVDSLAYAAKLLAGDIVLHVDGFDTPNGPTLVQVLKAHKPGDTVFIEGVRDGKGFNTTLVLHKNVAGQ